MAQLSIKRLRSVNQTGYQMARLVKDYWTDVLFFSNTPLIKFFNLVKRLKYIPDARGIEIIHRPKHVLNPKAKYRDCDDKAILLGAYLYMKKIPFRFIAVSNRPDKTIHHVLIQAKVYNKSRLLDGTYPKNKIFKFKPIHYFKPISKWLVRK